MLALAAAAATWCSSAAAKTVQSTLLPALLHGRALIDVSLRPPELAVCKYLSKIFKEQKIANKDDFKHLCRKITHTVCKPTFERHMLYA